MIPLEIFEYKNRWKPGHTVKVHSDFRMKGKDYCRIQMFQHQWDINENSAIYEDTYLFEQKVDADSFFVYFEKKFK